MQIDEDIFEFLQSKAAQPGESMSDVLRRELQLRTVEIDDDLFAYLLSRTLEIGESASDILRRELHIAPDDDHDRLVVSFHIAAGTDANAWNSPDDPRHRVRG